MSTRLEKWMYLLVVALGLVWGVCFTYAPQGWQAWGQFRARNRS